MRLVRQVVVAGVVAVLSQAADAEPVPPECRPFVIDVDTACGGPRSVLESVRRAFARQEANGDAELIAKDRKTLERVKAEYDHCVEDAEARRVARESHVTSASRAEVERIPEACRTPAETARLAELVDRDLAANAFAAKEREAAARQRALARERADDPVWQQRAISARVCALDLWKRSLERGIAEEKASARKYGGFVNATAIYDAQQTIRAIDRERASVLQRLRHLKKGALSCQSKEIALVPQCMRLAIQNGDDTILHELDEVDAACSTEAVRDVLALDEDQVLE